MQTPCPAIFFTGLSAEKHYVKVIFNPTSLSIKGDSIDETWNTSDYKFEKPNQKNYILQNGSKELHFTRNTIEAHFYNHPFRNDYKFFFKVSRWQPYVIGIVAASVVLYFLTLEASDYFLNQFSLKDQQVAFSFLDQSYVSKNCMSEDTQSLIDKTLVETGHPEFVGRVFYTESPVVNAFALPSGAIIFTNGFLKQMESVEEFIAVLFHEIGHVKHRHHLKRLRNAVGLNIVSLLVFGENTGVRDALSRFLINQYTSSQEEESDLYAREKLDEHGISRLGAINFFERNNENSALAIFSTHPSSQRRIEILRENFPKKIRKEFYPEMLTLLKKCGL